MNLRMNAHIISLILSFFLLCFSSIKIFADIISPEISYSYIEKFNAQDDEITINYVSNKATKDFFDKNVPLFECPDKDIESVYYFRWWTFRKHIKKTPDGFVITEFLPKVPWSGAYNTINCPAALHIREGRWLRDSTFVRDYINFWSLKKAKPRQYSFWPAYSAYEFYQVTGDKSVLINNYEFFKFNFSQWQKTHRLNNEGLFWQIDNNDGMECSISGELSENGKGFRVTINSYMYAEAAAISKIADMLDKNDEKIYYETEAKKIKELINNKLWDKSANFYKVIPFGKSEFSDARELHGYTPWFFNIAPKKYAQAWSQITDKNGFDAPYGLTSAEQRHPKFALNYNGHECQWNGPVWPYSTSVTLVGLANALRSQENLPVTKEDYYKALKTYAKSHQRILENGQKVFWIDENINPYTGDWISRTRLLNWDDANTLIKKGGIERGKCYNHSLFCDLIISGLLGVSEGLDSKISVNPIIPDNWDYFCLQGLRYKNQTYTIFYDKSGIKYNRGKGLHIIKH